MALKWCLHLSVRAHHKSISPGGHGVGDDARAVSSAPAHRPEPGHVAMAMSKRGFMRHRLVRVASSHFHS